jgi:hypothetical protein
MEEVPPKTTSNGNIQLGAETHLGISLSPTSTPYRWRTSASRSETPNHTLSQLSAPTEYWKLVLPTLGSPKVWVNRAGTRILGSPILASPASRTTTVTAGSSERRDASASPAVLCCGQLIELGRMRRTYPAANDHVIGFLARGAHVVRMGG